MTKHITHLQNLVFMKFKVVHDVEVICVNLVLLIQLIILKKNIICCKKKTFLFFK